MAALSSVLSFRLRALASRAALAALASSSLAACGAKPPPAGATPKLPGLRVANVRFGYDGADALEDMRLARLDGTDVWLGTTTLQLTTVVTPKLIDTVIDAAASAPVAGVVEADPPPGHPLLAIAGAGVQVLDEQYEVMCQGTLRAPRLRYASTVPDDTSEEALVEALIKEGNPQLRATLEAPCKGAFLAGPRAAALHAPTLEDGAIPEATLAALRTWDDAQSGDITQLTDGATGFVFVTVDTPDSCDRSEAHEWALHRATRDGATWTLDPVADGQGQDSTALLLDLDGDGALDFNSERGAFVAGSWTDWNPDLRVYWPPGLGCDGYDGEPLDGSADPPDDSD